MNQTPKSENSFVGGRRFSATPRQPHPIPATEALIAEILNEESESPPRLRSKVQGYFRSYKLGKVVPYQDVLLDYRAALEMEYNPAVTAYAIRPSVLEVDYQTAKGRKAHARINPTFFQTQDDSAGWVVVMNEQALRTAAKKQPTLFVRGKNGRWECPAGKTYAAALGLTYEVWSSDNLAASLALNHHDLARHLGNGASPPSAVDIQRVREIVETNQGVSLAALKQECNHPDYEVLTALIAHGHLWVDLRTTTLANRRAVKVYSSPAAAEFRHHLQSSSPLTVLTGPAVQLIQGEYLVIDEAEYYVADVGDTLIHFSPTGTGSANRCLERTQAECLVAEGKIRPGRVVEAQHYAQIDRLMKLSRKEHATACVRLGKIKPYLDAISRGESLARIKGGVPPCIRRWLRAYLQAEANGSPGLLALVGHVAQRGNRKARFSPAIEGLMQSVIAEHYECLANPGIVSAYGIFQQRFATLGLDGTLCPSEKTFRARVADRRAFEQMLKRQGIRAALPLSHTTKNLADPYPYHATYPFELVHCDHTQADIELRRSGTAEVLGRPWITILVDAYSRRLLAVIVSYNPPSAVSVLRALRECARRFGRLPQTLVVDNGAEFNSADLNEALHHYGAGKQYRPPAHPKYGAVCERLFKTLNDDIFHQLYGNTKLMKKVGQICESNNPKNLATWTLEALHEVLIEHAYEVYDQCPHSSLHESPRVHFDRARATRKMNCGRLAPYGHDLVVYTSPFVGRTKVKLRAGVGVQSKYHTYWAEDFETMSSKTVYVLVRYDPDDLSRVYVYFGGVWVIATTHLEGTFVGKSVRTITAMSDELTKLLKATGSNRKIRGNTLAIFSTEVLKKQRVLLQEKRDAESRRLLPPAELIDLTADPTPAARADYGDDDDCCPILHSA